MQFFSSLGLSLPKHVQHLKPNKHDIFLGFLHLYARLILAHLFIIAEERTLCCDEELTSLHRGQYVLSIFE